MAELSPGQRRWRAWAAGLALAAALTAAFALAPVPPGDDWETFAGAARRLWAGQPVYGTPITHSYYSNPPWLAAVLLPLGVLPPAWGRAGLAALSLLCLGALARRFRLDRLRLSLLLLSPPVFYILLHGQVDALVLAGLLLPRAAWPLVALTKPQVGAGLLFGLRRADLARAALVTAGGLALSWLVFGNWPAALLGQAAPFIWGPHNLWLGLWPFQVPVGIGLALYGHARQDERWLIAASPFFLPYATTSSLLGPWLAAAAGLSGGQALLVCLAWWGAVLYRGLGGV